MGSKIASLSGVIIGIIIMALGYSKNDLNTIMFGGFIAIIYVILLTN
ncbi:MAG: hypothetical protein AABY22_06360 [Nanoarchaeota archaeon]